MTKATAAATAAASAAAGDSKCCCDYDDNDLIVAAASYRLKLPASHAATPTAATKVAPTTVTN